jgi:hypothetical protein
MMACTNSAMDSRMLQRFGHGDMGEAEDKNQLSAVFSLFLFSSLLFASLIYQMLD